MINIDVVNNPGPIVDKLDGLSQEQFDLLGTAVQCNVDREDMAGDIAEAVEGAPSGSKLLQVWYGDIVWLFVVNSEDEIPGVIDRAIMVESGANKLAELVRPRDYEIEFLNRFFIDNWSSASLWDACHEARRGGMCFRDIHLNLVDNDVAVQYARRLGIIDDAWLAELFDSVAAIKL